MRRVISLLVVAVCVLGVISSVGWAEKRWDGRHGRENKGVFRPMERVFAYGTLLEHRIQESVIGRRVAAQEDSLAGYRKDTINLGGGTYFIAVRDPESSIDGGVLEVTPSELARVDRYEGSAYERAKVTLSSGQEAWVYRAWE